jgi:hypothetical protein
MHAGDRGVRDFDGVAMIDGVPHCRAVMGDRLLTVALFDDVGVMGRDDVGGFGNAPPGVSAGRSSSW